MRVAAPRCPLQGAAARRAHELRRHCAAVGAAPGGREAAAQLTLDTPLPKRVSVGIIGGGLAGAACAAGLSEQGIESTVYDSGVHGPGGRLGTREQGGLVFDHAAQYFVARTPRFQAHVQRWQDAGVVTEWAGAVGTLHPGGRFEALPATTPARLVARAGMRSLAEHVLADAQLATLRKACWVGEMQVHDGAWRLRQGGSVVGAHQFVVIAHNGKCATRLLRPSGAPLVDAQMARMKLNSIWCLLVAFAEPLRAPCEGAFVAGGGPLAWAGNNTAKLQLSGEGGECWTLLSSAAYGKRNKVPQEAVPPDVAARVTAELLAALAAALGRPALPATTFTRVQLWGAALPTNTPRVPCIFDGAARVGMCGDWLLGATMEDAMLSGLATADALGAAIAASRAGAASLAHLSLGLDARFAPVVGSDIGTAERAAGSSSAAGGKPAASGRSYVSRGERRGAAAQLQSEVRSLNAR